MSNRNFKVDAEILEKRKMMELKECNKKQKNLFLKKFSKSLKIDKDFFLKNYRNSNKKIHLTILKTLVVVRRVTVVIS